MATDNTRFFWVALTAPDVRDEATVRERLDRQLEEAVEYLRGEIDTWVCQLQGVGDGD